MYVVFETVCNAQEEVKDKCADLTQQKTQQCPVSVGSCYIVIIHTDTLHTMSRSMFGPGRF